MLYAILVYDCEAALELPGAPDMVTALSGPVIHLLPTTTAITLRKDPAAGIADGPFAQTAEQLIGCHIVDCPGLDEAIAAAGDLAAGRGTGALEVRPLHAYSPGMLRAWP